MSKSILRLNLLVVALVFLATSAGCMFVHAEVKLPPLGRELYELKLAHDAGAISDEEYAQFRAAAIDRAEKCKHESEESDESTGSDE